ncbi:AraC family transcriptional regulator [Neorhizobium lilium]|uniref:AraC family transcriptional regulator n=1 Tax=Neorhizobium lilium TaxID=2503024 RepID=A0A3S3RPN1_9HYPH|nr:helix-turn-helix transcriptional regulator [Neorhizobium lilium]RWX74765.1 AraC family transcriptional regulator [Neorhizobium lilium]
MRVQSVTENVSVITQKEKNFASGQHSHPQAQLIYAVSGVVEVITELGLWVVPPSRAIWVPPLVNHVTRSHGDVEFRALLINSSCVGDLPAHCMVVQVSPLLRELIVRLADLAETRQYHRERIDVILQLLMMEIVFTPIAAFSLTMPKDQRLVELCDRIRLNPSISISIETAASKTGMSRASLMRRFAGETGLGLGRWQQQARLLKALRLLAQGCNIIDVANECGYDSPSAFSAMFRRSLGRVPSGYFNDSGAG